MAATRIEKRIPVEFSDLEFINAAAHHAAKNKFRYDSRRTRGENADKFNSLTRTFISELKSFLICPQNTDIRDLGKTLHYMRNIDRLVLFKMRPDLINHFKDLYWILNYHIEGKNRLLIACSKAALIYDPDPAVCEHQLDSILKLIPRNNRDKFEEFAKRIITKQTDSPEQPGLNPLYSLSASFILAASTIISQSTDTISAMKNTVAFASVCALIYAMHEYFNLDESEKPDNMISRSRHTMWQTYQPQTSNHTPADVTPVVSRNPAH